MRERNQLLTLASEVKEHLQEITFISQQGERWLGTKGDHPDPYDLRAAGSILHDFYTALEDVFKRIAQEINGGLPQDREWHKRLLESMARDIPGVRPPVISKELKKELNEYLRFRHVFRNVYGHYLEWERMKHLMQNLSRITKDVCRNLERFCQHLIEIAENL